jgi:hypothetical protein
MSIQDLRPFHSVLQLDSCDSDCFSFLSFEPTPSPVRRT